MDGPTTGIHPICWRLSYDDDVGVYVIFTVS